MVLVWLAVAQCGSLPVTPMPVIAIVAMERGWYSICRLPAELRAAGWTVHALCDPGSPLGTSRHLAGIVRWDRRSTKLPGARYRLWTLLREVGPDWIIPGDDAAAHYLCRIRDGAIGRDDGRLRAVLRESLPPWDVLTRLDFKDEFASLCVELGLPAISTTTCALPALEKDPVAAVPGYPAILKLAFGAGGSSVIGVHRPDDLPLAIRALRRQVRGRRPAASRLRWGWDIAHHPRARPPRVCVQPWIDGAHHQLVFVGFGGRLIGATVWRVLRRVTAFGPSSVVRSESRPDVVALVQRLLAATRFSGFGQIEFIDERATARTYLGEMNARPVAAHSLGKHVGADLAKVFTAAFAGEAPLEPVIGTGGVTIALFPHELERDPESTFLGQALHDVPWDDPPLLARLGRRSGFNSPDSESADEGWPGFEKT